MRFINFITIASALVCSHVSVVHGSSVSPQEVVSVGAGNPVDEYVHDRLVSGASIEHFAAGNPGVALFIQRPISRPRSAAVIGVANIVNVPHFAVGGAEDHGRAAFQRTLTLVRATLLRNPHLTHVLINGANSFDTIISSASSDAQEAVRATLCAVIHETFDGMSGKTIKLNNLDCTPSMSASSDAAVYIPMHMEMGIGTFGRLAVELPHTLIVNVYSEATATSGVGLNGVLSQMIAGGLATLPTGIPDTLIAPRVVAVAPVVVEPVVVNDATEDSESTGSDSVVETGGAAGLSEEEEAMIAALYASELEDGPAVVATTDAVAEADVRPADPQRTMRLMGDEDDLPPFDPSSITDPELRAAIEASRAAFMSHRAVGGGFDADAENQLLGAVIEESMRPVAPRSSVPDLDSVISAWIAEGTNDIEQLQAQLMSTGLDEDTAAEMAEMYRA